MSWWRVQLEVRKPGAMGEFQRMNFPVRADIQETAVKWAMDDAHAEGWETRGVLLAFHYQSKYDRDITMGDDLPQPE